MSSDRGRFTLSSGHKVALEYLNQWAVYAGLLEGLPTRHRNDREIENIVEQTRRRDGHPPFLITPAQTPIQHEGPYCSAIRRAYLPSLASGGFTRSGQLAILPCTARISRSSGSRKTTRSR
jgi:hypothetical protein